MLRDGSAVLIRQIQVTDAPLVAGIFAGLSPTSRWMRFLAAKNHLSDAELRYLTDLDHHDHEAVIALDPGGNGIGAARYIRHAHDRPACRGAVRGTSCGGLVPAGPGHRRVRSCRRAPQPVRSRH